MGTIMTASKRRIVALSGLSVFILTSVLLVAGCGKKDDAPPAGSGNYYTGPMAKKQGPATPPEGTK